jgi:predicted Zn-dependent peptidase
LYKERFSNGDYDYYIVGDIDYNSLKLAIEKYLASIERKVIEDYSPIKLKQLSEDKLVARNYASGEDTNVVMVFGDKEKIDDNYEYYSSMVRNALDTELIKEVREKLSGAYNISAWVDIYKHELDRGRLFVSFSCKPERAKELMEAVRKTIKSVMDGNIGDETISYLKESYKRDYERNQGTNDYYISYFENEIWGEEQLISPMEYNELVSKENIINFLDDVYGMYEGDFILYPADYEK